MKFSLSFFLLSTLLLADENISLDDDFLHSLEEVSEIATKSKLNIDDSPSFVTVLHSEKLTKLGVSNVFEALGHVPGVQLGREASGVPIVIFRGVAQKGEVKLMLDGVTINNSYRGSSYYLLTFPIELVQRIEVIRGAGSILYGSGAISGVINIITKASQRDAKNRQFVSAGSNDMLRVGAVVSQDIEDVKITADGYFNKDSKSIYVSPNSSEYSGQSDRHLKDYSVGIYVGDEHLSLQARLTKSQEGNAYGVFGILDKEDSKYQNINKTGSIQLSYSNSISEDSTFSLLGGYSDYSQNVEAAYSLGTLIAIHKEGTYYSQLDVASKYFSDNELLVGAKFESSKALEDSFTLGDSISNPNSSREISTLYITDIYTLLANVDISLGLRYDNYSDYGESLSPNFGIVYALNDKVSLKATHTHSYRAPSWLELTSNANLEAEKANSLEAGLIYKMTQQNIMRVNFYTYVIDDMITKDSVTREYIQKSKNNFYGAEFDYKRNIERAVELEFYASYVKAVDDDKEDLEGIANILSSMSLIYNTNNRFSFGSTLKYISSVNRSSSDSREKMSSSFIYDQTITYNYKAFSASLTIKDLFDAKRYYALPQSSYQTDFYDGGRELFINASLEF
jgi:iron complex outermembrane receptor protein